MQVPLLHDIDFRSGQITGAQRSVRRLSDLTGVFVDEAAYQAALAKEDAVVYYVYVVYPEPGEGDLAYGTTVLMPGQVGDEYYMTRGHRHVSATACEVYLGLAGTGCLVVRQSDDTKKTLALPVSAGVVAYSPPGAAHRLVNTGNEPFITVAVWAADAGQDYDSVKGLIPALAKSGDGLELRLPGNGALEQINGE
jgi:glucose-6-phosphate isomerase